MCSGRCWRERRTDLKRAVFALWLLLGCARQERSVTAESAAGTERAPLPAAADPAAVKGACPATGDWSACAVVERLDRAGLAPRIDSSSTAEEPPLTARGTLVHVGRSELELYVYPDVAARERDERRLDIQKYLAADAPIGMTAQPTLLHSANLIAILHSRNDHQRERVADAIGAGPPQPARP